MMTLDVLIFELQKLAEEFGRDNEVEVDWCGESVWGEIDHLAIEFREVPEKPVVLIYAKV